MLANANAHVSIIDERLVDGAAEVEQLRLERLGGPALVQRREAAHFAGGAREQRVHMLAQQLLLLPAQQEVPLVLRHRLVDPVLELVQRVTLAPACSSIRRLILKIPALCYYCTELN